MLSHEENNLLTRVEGDTPMGGIMRSHWIPACLSEEVAEPDGTPVRIRLLGERLVAFRDSDGKLGLIDETCPHRRASLALARNEECGLRCLYHGWKFDVAGNCVDMSSEPPGSELPKKVKIKSYPVHEHCGLIFTYMGPPKSIPTFDPPVYAPSCDTRIATSKMVIRCNWAQILEGSIDSAHSSSLHSSDMVPARILSADADAQRWYRPSTDKSPRLETQRTPFGFRYAAIRRPIKDASTHDYIRTTLFIAPWTVHIPSNDQYHLATVHIPMDDETTAFYFIAYGTDNVPSNEDWRRFMHVRVGIDLDQNYVPIRNMENNYKQDRQAMKLGSYTGIDGIPNQDMAMWETMGPIVDRTRDKLGASDLAIVEFRRVMTDAAKDFQNGKPAIGTTEPKIPQATLHSFQGIVPKGTDWRLLNVEEIEKRLIDEQTTQTTRAAE